MKELRAVKKSFRKLAWQLRGSFYGTGCSSDFQLKPKTRSNSSRQILPSRPNPRAVALPNPPRCPNPRNRFFAAEFFVGGAERRCGSVSDPHRRAAGWVGAMWRSFSPTRATIPPPRRNRMNTGFRATTAARRTSPAQGAIIAAETKASRGCWRHDPRSGAGAKSLPTTACYRTSETKKRLPRSRSARHERGGRTTPRQSEVYRSYRRACRSGGFGAAEAVASGAGTSLWSEAQPARRERRGFAPK